MFAAEAIGKTAINCDFFEDPAFVRIAEMTERKVSSMLVTGDKILRRETCLDWFKILWRA